MTRLVCTVCGHVGETKSITKGSFGVELLLWLCFIIPGLIYSFWRLSSRTEGCAKCGSADVIPVDTPVGRRIVSETAEPGAVQVVAEVRRPPSKAAHSAGASLGRLWGRMIR